MVFGFFSHFLRGTAVEVDDTTDGTTDGTTDETYNESAAYLQNCMRPPLKYPKIAIICGSGLGLLAETVERNSHPSMSVDYISIPHFPPSTGKNPKPLDSQPKNSSPLLQNG